MTDMPCPPAIWSPSGRRATLPPGVGFGGGCRPAPRRFPPPHAEEGGAMASRPPERAMDSEQVAPVLLSRVLNSFDLMVIFVAVVLFIVNASTIQSAGPAAFVYWILGFLTFLIPGAIVTAQLGRM